MQTSLAPNCSGLVACNRAIFHERRLLPPPDGLLLHPLLNRYEGVHPFVVLGKHLLEVIVILLMAGELLLGDLGLDLEEVLEDL